MRTGTRDCFLELETPAPDLSTTAGPASVLRHDDDEARRGAVRALAHAIARLQTTLTMTSAGTWVPDLQRE